jgi:CRISPR/Cas system-associated exonuclease Cas4 (RecB family)
MSNLPLPGTANYLALLNHHPRDEHISFEEGPHIYTVCGERGTYKSVTTWNHSHFSHFDADKIIDNMISSGKLNDPNNKYHGMTKPEIKALWAKNGAAASGSGTKMHEDIEHYYNGMTVENDSIEFSYFLNFVKDHPELKPYRTEWMVYYEELMISGSIDMVFENPDGTIRIYDWKRCKEIKSEVEFGKYAHTTCISHLPDVNFWHYALQLNVYKTILEHKYGKKVTQLCLVCIHPDNSYKNYECIEVPVLEKEIKDLMELRLKEVEQIKQKKTSNYKRI